MALCVLTVMWCVLVQRHSSDIRGPRDADDTLCVDCANGTQGSHCHECRNGYFRLGGRALTEPCQV